MRVLLQHRYSNVGFLSLAVPRIYPSARVQVSGVFFMNGR